MSCECADLQLLQRSRCEDKKSLWLSVLYPSCMYQAVEHCAFNHFHRHLRPEFSHLLTQVFSLFLFFFLPLFLSFFSFRPPFCFTDRGHLKKEAQTEREWERKTREERVEYNVLGEWRQTNSRVFLIFSGCQRDQAERQDGTKEDTDHADHGWEEPAGQST